MTALTELSIDCPFCGRVAGERCVTLEGKTMSSHPERYSRYQREARRAHERLQAENLAPRVWPLRAAGMTIPDIATKLKKSEALVRAAVLLSDPDRLPGDAAVSGPSEEDVRRSVAQRNEAAKTNDLFVKDEPK